MRANCKTVIVLLITELLITGSLRSQQPEEGVYTNPQAHPEELSSLRGHFERIFDDGQSVDSINGEFYYFDHSKIFFDIKYPLHQIMIIDNKITIIFYPSSRKAFRLESANPIVLPLIPGLIAAIKSDYGLSDIGFKLLNQEIKGDTIITFWSHPELKEKIGNYEIAEVNDHLVYSIYEAPDGLASNKTNFSKFISAKGFDFPTKIESEIYSRERYALEKVTLDDVEVNETIPAKISNFKIPESVQIEEKKW